MSQIPLRARLRYIVGKRQVQRRFLLVTVISLILLFGDGTILEIEEIIPFEDFPIRFYVLKEDNSVDADSDVDSTSNIGSNSSDYTNAQSLDGTYQTINESIYLPDYGGGGAGAMFKIMNQETGEIVNWRGQNYRHFYNATTESYHFQTSQLVYKEDVVAGTNWILPDEYPTRFIIRLENGSIYRFGTPYAVESFFSGIANNTLWGVGVEGYDGVLAFNLAIDNTYGHGQYMYYPRLRDGTLPNYNQPLYTIFDHLYVNISDTIYDVVLMNKTLYGAGQNPRNLLHFEITSDTMTVWFPINGLDLLGQEFDFRHGFKWNQTDGLFHMITDFRCTTRGFDDIGMAYEILVSPQAEGTSYQPEYFAITNGTHTKTLNVTQAWEAGTYLEDFYSQISIISENGNTFRFSFEDMENAGLTQKYLNLHDQEIPARGTKKALRAGMYGYGSYTQNDWVEIDPTFSAKQTTDEYDFYVTYDASPAYTAYTTSATMTVGYEKIGAYAAVHRGFVTFDTGITQRICEITNANMTVYIETEAGESGEYVSLGLYYNESLVGGFWNESYADPNDQTVYNQPRYWTEASAFLSDQTGNISISSSIVNTMLSNWLENHNADPANRQYIPLIMQNGTGQTTSTDDQNTLSESTTATTSQRMTLEFDYVIPEILDITQFAKYKNITIHSSKITGNHSYFPVMIDIYDPDLRVEGRIQSDADDLAFRRSDGYELFYDLEYFNQTFNDTHAHLVAWVDIPSLVDYQDTEIQMWYGNPTMTAQEHPEYVFCNTYVGVYHLSEDPTGTIYDSTSNSLDGSSEGSMEAGDQIDSWIDGGLDFSTNDYVSLSDNSLWTFNDAGQDQPVSFSAWIKIDTGSQVNTIAAKYDSTTNGEWNFQLDASDYLTIVFTDSDGGTYIGRKYGTGLSVDKWQFVYAVYNGDESEGGIDLYVNGSLVDDTAYSFGTYDGMNDDTVAAIIGASNTGSTGNFEGIIDEVRVQGTNRSANWILTEWNNQGDPSTFFTITYEATYRLSWEHQAQSVDIHKDSYNLTVYGSFYSGLKPDTWSSWSSELTTNGGFETGDFTGWTEYTFQGDADWTAGTDPAFGNKGTQSGSYCAFIDENSNQGDYIRQDIDVSAYAFYIDIGRAVVNATGWGVSAETGSDYFRIRTQALDASKTVIGSDLSDTGYSLSATWTEYGAENESLPTGTRYIRIWGYTYENGWDSGSVDSYSVKVRYKEVADSHSEEAYNFGYYKTMYIDSTEVVGSSDFTNFTVLVNFYDTTLRNPVKAQADGDDIAFGNETMMFSHDLELFDQDYNDTHAHLVAWVRIPTLYASVDTKMYLYYGNSTMSAQESPEDVWDSNYRGVWHLGDGTTGTSPYYYDSTSYSHDGLALNSPINDTTSKIDGGVTFDDSNERAVNISHTTDLQLVTNMYIQAWIRTTDSETDVGLVVNKWTSGTEGRNYWIGKLNENNFAFYIDDTANVQYGLSNFNDGDWHLVICIANSTHMEMFLDGQSVADTTWDGTSVLGTADVHIGKACETSEQEWDGDIDEVRIATNGRGASWIETEWNTQDDPSSFFHPLSDEYALERVKIELWNTSSSSWIETTYYIEGEEQWYNFTIDTFSGVVSSSITWRYVDSWQISCDLDKHTLEVDYAGIAYWNFSVNIIETTINFGQIANDSNWHEDPNKPVYINVSSGIAYDLEIRGSDGAYNPVSNEQIRFNTVDNPATGTNLTSSYQTLYNDQSAGETQLVVYLWVTGNYREYIGPYTFTLQIRIKKA